MAQVGRTFTKRIEVIGTNPQGNQVIRAETVFLVPVPPNSALSDPRNVPSALYPDADSPGHGGYTTDELAAFKSGLLVEVVDLYQYDSSGNAQADTQNDKSALRNKIKARYNELKAAQKAPNGGFIGMSWNDVTNSWTDFPQ